MSESIRAARGAKRLQNIEALPVLDNSNLIRFFGSMSKTGDNADWDWGFFQDENGEWILMEEDGAGCIFNFTQHRYPSSPVPTFRFYFDNSETPQFTVTPADFGEKAPFLKPLADKFVGPEDNGRGPIWVIRSFVPMEFRTHCKITSSIPLRGCEKDKGEGGWGHVIYQLYDSPEGLTTFSSDLDVTGLVKKYAAPVSIPATDTVKKQGDLLPGKEQTVTLETKGAVVGISLSIRDFDPAFARDLQVRLCFDGTTSVAPIGTLFGCEYAESPADLQTALLTFRFDGKDGFFENRFPMPFFRQATLSLLNTGTKPALITEFSVSVNDTLCYDPKMTGLFTASKYLPPTDNIAGLNSVIADVSGQGHFAYGVISGHEIMNAGCEGDVRVFLDDVASPALESDGSESWASYGWGFVCPPQSNPFSCYHGVPDVNHTWSECRLAFSDSYPFRSRFRFELEHGEVNNGGGRHSGQCFLYQKPDPAETLLAELSPADVLHDGTVTTKSGKFENGIHDRTHTFETLSGETFVSFEVSVPQETDFLILKRVSFQEEGPMAATVLLNGKPLDHNWLYTDFNDCYTLLEDCFLIPGSAPESGNTAQITIKPLTRAWNFCRYRIFAVKK